LVFGFSAAALLMGIGPSQAQGVTEQDILHDATTTNQVVSYGLGPRAQRYSPLNQINAGNAKDLVPVWSFSFGGEKQRGQESQAMVYDGVIYVTGSYSRVYAIDAKTGEELWQYDARLPQGILPCCDVINRGVALYDDLVYFGTLDAKVVALDRKTGNVVWSKKLDDYKEGYSITAAPIIVNGKVIVTNAGGEFGVIGRVRALDAKTGEVVWERPTVEGHTGVTLTPVIGSATSPEAGRI
jgi:alcohol dehydrogenase (cytochrome c)